MVYYDGFVFTKDECESILNSATTWEKSSLKNSVGSKIVGSVYLPKKRKSKQSEQIVGKDSFIYKKINNILNSFNYELVIDEFAYDVVKYEEGDFIWKHKDDMENRLLSFVIQLNDDLDYEGGDFLYWLDDEYRMDRKQGNGIIFKAGVYHEVKPITKGIRHSFVSFLTLNQIRQISKKSFI
jgi:hypothetical protein